MGKNNSVDNIRCVIVDDEPLALDILENYIQRIPGLELAARCGNAIDAAESLKNGNVDLLFLDIKMPGLSGIELVKIFENLPPVVFTTAYEDYAIEGYELNVFDYLLKPVAFERFFKTITRFRELKRKSADKKVNTTGKLRLKLSGKVLFLEPEKILFLESLRNNTRVVTIDKEYISLNNLSEIEQQLPAEKFIRIHRSFIVAVDKIETVGKLSVGTGKYELPVGKKYFDRIAFLIDQ